ncbi:hypothetical protein V6N13_075210 [Hibiscus sabdariffa]
MEASEDDLQSLCFSGHPLAHSHYPNISKDTPCSACGDPLFSTLTSTPPPSPPLPLSLPPPPPLSSFLPLLFSCEERDEESDRFDSLPPPPPPPPLPSFAPPPPPQPRRRYFGPGAFSCEECDQFHLHEACAMAPAEFAHHPLHWEHPFLTLEEDSGSCCDLCLESVVLCFWDRNCFCSPVTAPGNVWLEFLEPFGCSFPRFVLGMFCM